MADEKEKDERKGAEERDDLKPAPDQAELNVRAYERVFGLCLEAAERLDNGRFDLPSHERVIRIAESLFDRFWTDQSEILGAERKAGEFAPIINTLSNAMQGRLY